MCVAKSRKLPTESVRKLCIFWAKSVSPRVECFIAQGGGPIENTIANDEVDDWTNLQEIVHFCFPKRRSLKRTYAHETRPRHNADGVARAYSCQPMSCNVRQRGMPRYPNNQGFIINAT